MGGSVAGSTSRVARSHIETSLVETSRVETPRVETSRVETSRIETSRVEASRAPAGGVELGPMVRRFLKALASESRQQVMLLFTRGAELTVGEVARRLGIGQSTASEQLAQLQQGGILVSRRDGKTVYYRGDPTGAAMVLAELQAYLSQCCPSTPAAGAVAGPGARSGEP